MKIRKSNPRLRTNLQDQSCLLARDRLNNEFASAPIIGNNLFSTPRLGTPLVIVHVQLQDRLANDSIVA